METAPYINIYCKIDTNQEWHETICMTDCHTVVKQSGFIFIFKISSSYLLYMSMSGFQSLAGGTRMSFTLLYSVVFHRMLESVHSWGEDDHMYISGSLLFYKTLRTISTLLNEDKSQVSMHSSWCGEQNVKIYLIIAMANENKTQMSENIKFRASHSVEFREIMGKFDCKKWYWWSKLITASRHVRGGFIDLSRKWRLSEKSAFVLVRSNEGK